MKPKAPERILVIRLGALGDLVLCFQAFHEIRQAHPTAKIALLTMPAFASFAHDMPWFDQVLIDERPPLKQFKEWWKLLKQIKTFAPTRVYDLQGKFRQTLLYTLLGGFLTTEWSGAAPLCSHPRLWPPLPNMHFTDFIKAQLRRANVPPQPAPDLSWLDAPLDGMTPPTPYVLLIPGCSPTRENKRWPAHHYAEFVNILQKKGIASLAVGTKADAKAITDIKALAPTLIDLCGKTSLKQLASLARHSLYVIGNDTGPTHLAASVGAPTLTLMREQANTAWSSPHGIHAGFLQGKPLETLSPNKVYLALAETLDKNTNPVSTKD